MDLGLKGSEPFNSVIFTKFKIYEVIDAGHNTTQNNGWEER